MAGVGGSITHVSGVWVAVTQRLGSSGASKGSLTWPFQVAWASQSMVAAFQEGPSGKAALHENQSCLTFMT